MSGAYSIWGAGAEGAAHLTASFNNEAVLRHMRVLSHADQQGWRAARVAIGSYMVGEIQDNLDGQKLYDGSAMPQSEAAKKRAGKTLIEHHHLYDSYVYQLAYGGVEVGSAMVYAAIHHFGGMTGRGHKTKITARPVLGMTDRSERRIGDILVAELEALQ